MRAKRAPLVTALPIPIPTKLYVDQLGADPGDILWKRQPIGHK